MARRAYRVADRQFGGRHAVTLAAQFGLANSLRLLGLYKQALSNALAVLEVASKPRASSIWTQPGVAISPAESIAPSAATKKPSRFAGALAICETALGAEHPDTATGLDNLAGLYRAQGRYGEAEPLYRRALAIRETALGRCASLYRGEPQQSR